MSEACFLLRSVSPTESVSLNFWQTLQLEQHQRKCISYCYDERADLDPGEDLQDPLLPNTCPCNATEQDPLPECFHIEREHPM